MGGILLTLALSGLVLYFFVIKWEQLSYKNLSFKRTTNIKRSFPGEEMEMTIEATNKKILPLTWIELESIIPSEMKIVGEKLSKDTASESIIHITVLSLLWYQRLKRRYTISFDKRGYYILRDIKVRTGDYFGIKSYEKPYSCKTEVLIYPIINPLEQLIIESKSYLGETVVNRWIIDDPTFQNGIREYTFREPLKTIHWLASAKTGRLQVKKNQYSSDMAAIYIVNVQTYKVFWHGNDSQTIEKLIEIAASHIDEAEKNKIPYGLATNSSIPGETLTELVVSPAMGPGHFQRIFDYLAKMTVYRVRPIEEIINKITSTLPNHVFLSLITPLVDNEIVEALYNAKRRGFALEITTLQQWADHYPELYKIAKVKIIREEGSQHDKKDSAAS